MLTDKVESMVDEHDRRLLEPTVRATPEYVIQLIYEDISFLKFHQAGFPSSLLYRTSAMGAIAAKASCISYGGQ